MPFIFKQLGILFGLSPARAASSRTTLTDAFLLLFYLLFLILSIYLVYYLSDLGIRVGLNKMAKQIC